MKNPGKHTLVVLFIFSFKAAGPVLVPVPFTPLRAGLEGFQPANKSARFTAERNSHAFETFVLKTNVEAAPRTAETHECDVTWFSLGLRPPSAS